MTAPDLDATRSWLALLYADAPGHLAVVSAPSFRAACFRTDAEGRDQAAIHLARKAAVTNSYLGCLTLTAPPATGRGGAGETLAAPGVWCDLDVAGPGHRWRDDDGRELRLPADRPEATSIASDFGLPPTALVDSGHGLYAWWLFAEPVVFCTADDRAGFAALSMRFGTTLVELGRRRGLHVDDVSDLARILRPPGSVNRKTTPTPVRLVEWCPERRYRPEDIAARCVNRVPDRGPHTAPHGSHPSSRQDGRESPAEAFARIVPWATVLEPAGFWWMHDRGEVAYWHHAASTTGPRSVSATTGANCVPVLVVHSESAAAATGLPCGPGHGLTKFRTWALLNFGGDESSAARALLRLGRGVA